MNFAKVLSALVSFFEAEKIDFALAGAFALKAYGYLRATSDVDFLVRAKDQKRIVAHLESIGYETLHRSIGFSNHLHPLGRLGRIDFIYVSGETADIILSQARHAAVLEGVRMPVTRPEHLVALKLFAVKNDPTRLYRELADIQQLMQLPDVDLDEIRTYFEKYGQLERFYEITGEERSGPKS